MVDVLNLCGCALSAEISFIAIPKNPVEGINVWDSQHILVSFAANNPSVMLMTDFPFHPYPWQLTLWQQLNQQRLADRLPHAMLLAGPKGLGKLHFAQAFAQLLLCASPTETLACGKCRSCLLNRAGNHPDFIELSPEESSRVIKVDQVREVIEQLNKTAQQGGYKVLVLNPAEAMNSNAANALLKSLEEPAAKTFLILVTHSPSSVLPTIRSRCQLRSLSLPNHEQLVVWLKPLLQEGADLDALIGLANGSPLGALALLNGDSLEKRKEWQGQWIQLSFSKITPIDLAAQWHKQDVVELADWVLVVLHNIALYQQVGDSKFLMSFPAEWLSFIRSLPLAPLHRYIEKWLATKRLFESNNNPNKQLLLEEMLMDWAALVRATTRVTTRTPQS